MGALSNPLTAQGDSGRPLLDLIANGDAATRGEAALLIAALRIPTASTLVRTLLSDRDREVRARAVLALGILSADGADSELGRRLEDRDETELVQQAAAYALGCLPDENPAPAVDRFLARAQGGSAKRHRDTLAALLAGLERSAHPLRLAQMEQVIRDQAIKDPGVLSLAVRALRRSGGQIEQADADRLLELRAASVRLEALAALAEIRAASPKLVETLVRLARRDAHASIRAAALRTLSKHGVTPAVDALLAEALASSTPELVEVAASVLSQRGREDDRAELASRARHATAIPLVRALLRGHDGTPTISMIETARAFAARPDASAADQAIGLRVLAQARDREAEPMIREFARRCTEPDLVTGAVTDLTKYSRGIELTEVMGLDAPDAATRLPTRIEALGPIDASLATRLAVRALEDPDFAPESRLAVLRAWRRAIWTTPSPATLDALPRELAELLR